MRFPSRRDYDLIIKLNKELTGTFVDLPVVIYKLHQELTKTNTYGEGVNKVWYVGVSVPCLSAQEPLETEESNMSIDITQMMQFAFLRQALKDADVWPEQGDLIEFRTRLYEIDNVDDSQFWAGRPEFNLSIVCKAHLTRKSNLQLEKPNL